MQKSSPNNSYNLNDFDVLVIGAGPAGGQCARRLAELGSRVLLIDRYDAFTTNNFSSAGTTLDLISEFDLPESVVGTYFQKIVLESTKARQAWQSSTPLGAVLEFSALREFLAQSCASRGGEFRLGLEYRGHVDKKSHFEVRLWDRKNESTQIIFCRYLVDASGPARALLGNHAKAKMLVARGIEYLVECKHQHSFSEQLVFLLGRHWAPEGYGWIFPMGPTRLKVGMGIMRHPKIGGNGDPAKLKAHTQKILHDYAKITDYKIIDVHGGVLRYSLGQKDHFYKGRIIAIGDAVSCVNPLGGEGIRHGMRCGHWAAEAIQQHASGEERAFYKYEKKVRHYLGFRWKISEWLARLIYNQLSDEAIDRGVRRLGRFTSAEAMMDVIFNYRFYRTLRTVLRAIWRGIYIRSPSPVQSGV